MMKYDPPYSEKQIEAAYGKDKSKKLMSDPVHSWRALTGIELIHKEPRLDELQRIWENWQLMTDDMKARSDAKSIILFGKTNQEHYDMLIGEYK
jgi:hypothetical protein